MPLTVTPANNKSLKRSANRDLQTNALQTMSMGEAPATKPSLGEEPRSSFFWFLDYLGRFRLVPWGQTIVTGAYERGKICSPCRQSVECVILEGMDHLAVLREKIENIRAEIAQIQALNEQYRRTSRNDPQAQVAHGERQERLQAIQQELAQLAGLGRRVLSIEQRKAEHRSRMNLVKEVS